MLEGCLQSVTWAKEIIVVDAKSVDETAKIARKYTSRVYSKTWSGFATQKNFGIQKATQKWVLILDADERVSPALAREIESTITNSPSMAAFSIPFRNFFLGKEMKHGGWQGERHIRLFLKAKAKYEEQQIHEFLKIDGQVGELQQPIFHFSHRTIAENLLKTRQYALLQSQYEYDRHQPQVTRWGLFKAIIEHFWLRYVILEGHKDGMEGFIEATYQAFSQIFVIQSMLWERQRNKNIGEIYRDLEKQLMRNS